MQQASAGIGRIDTLLRIKTALHQSGTVTLPAGPLAVCFDQVTFSYEDGEPASRFQTLASQFQTPASRFQASVLRDLSFSLEPGETLGLLGRTGSGKTTLTRLLARLYDPLAGSIRLAGIDLR